VSEVEVLCLTRGALDLPLYQGHVIRMDTFENGLERGANLRAEAVNSEHLVRPGLFSGRCIPAPAAGMTDPLPFSEKALAALQVGIKRGVLERDGGLRGQQLQHRYAG